MADTIPYLTTIQQSLDSTRDTSRQEPSGTVHVQANYMLQHHDKIAILFASIFVIERCRLPGQGQLKVISADTVCRPLRSAGLRVQRPGKGPILTGRHRNERRRWAGRYRHRRLQRWHGVLFSDESLFHLRNADGRLQVWRRLGECLSY